MKKWYFLLIFLSFGCGNKDIVINEKSFFVMDTFVNVKVFGEVKDNQILLEIEDVFMYYHRLTDRYQSYDDVVNVYDINNMETQYLEIDDELLYLINYGISFYQKSDGLFDIAMGDLIDVWKKHIGKYDYLPDISDLKLIQKKPIEIVDNKVYGDVNIDLGALAKGYALLKIGELLDEKGYKQYIINAGGQVLLGESYRKTPFNVGIKHPLESGNLLIVKGENINVSTSGSYERFFEIDGISYNHIISPKTLFPADYFLSVSVISEDSLLADVLTTTLFLMSIEEGLDFIKDYDAEAIWYTSDLKKVKSKGFYFYE